MWDSYIRVSIIALFAMLMHGCGYVTMTYSAPEGVFYRVNGLLHCRSIEVLRLAVPNDETACKDSLAVRRKIENTAIAHEISGLLESEFTGNEDIVIEDVYAIKRGKFLHVSFALRYLHATPREFYASTCFACPQNSSGKALLPRAAPVSYPVSVLIKDGKQSVLVSLHEFDTDEYARLYHSTRAFLFRTKPTLELAHEDAHDYSLTLSADDSTTQFEMLFQDLSGSTESYYIGIPLFMQADALLQVFILEMNPVSSRWEGASDVDR